MINNLIWHEWPIEKPEKETTDIGEEYLVELDWPYSRIAPLDYVKGDFWSGPMFSSTKWTNHVLRWAAMPILDTASTLT